MAQISQKKQRKINHKIKRRRWEVLVELDHMLEIPMIVLAFVFIVVFAYSLAVPGDHPFIKNVMVIIWYIYAAEFLLRFLVAPHKLDFLKHNWLAAISLFMPALRSLQVFNVMSSALAMGAFTGGNSIVLVLLSAVHRGMKGLRQITDRRGTAYVASLTVMVLVAGAAGMLACERDVHVSFGIHSFPQALYWTAMLLTTIGSDYWPQTAQGKLLCVALSLYAVGILGYVAGTLASFFIGNDAADPRGDVASEKEVRELKAEIQALRRAIERRGNLSS